MGHTTKEELNEIKINIIKAEIKDINRTILTINKILTILSVAVLLLGLSIIINILKGL